MAKKKYAKWVPFDESGNLITDFDRNQHDLDDQSTRDSYASYNWPTGGIHIKPNFEFNAVLTWVLDQKPGRRTFDFMDEDRRVYPILYRDLCKVFEEGRIQGKSITGRWTFDRQYGSWGAVLIG